MAPTPSVSLMTPTWAGDLEQYRILMRSLSRSPLADLEHITVVQTEDEPALRARVSSHSHIMTTAQLLPDVVESRRRHAMAWQALGGRHMTRISGSVSRAVGWPRWPRYTGWHTQQLCKLAIAARAATDYVLIVDSDVIVTPQAQLAPWINRPAIACISDRHQQAAFRGKTLNWVQQADRLLQAPTVDGVFDAYFDTPFLLHVDSVRALLAWLEEHYQCPWWLALVQQPPRRWSEFATYKRFLMCRAQIRGESGEEPGTGVDVDWIKPEGLHYIFDTSDSKRLLDEIELQLRRPETRFITVHSQSSGRQRWDARRFTDDLYQLL
ncbi:MAG: DUF6492 family protein [Pseudohongiella sp.]|uniref:DUF6492 family protein n=1 Tax=Pseudohongiella sp. TaxID=1979412 RepID=UPI0034A034C6